MAEKRVIITRTGVGIVGTVDLDEIGLTLEEAQKNPQHVLTIIERKHPTPAAFESRMQIRSAPDGSAEIVVLQVTKERWG